MPTAFIDRVDTLSMVERLGVVRSLTRMARVKFNPGDSRPQDFSILEAALAVVPAPFTTLSQSGFESLVLTERGPRLVEQDPGTVDVELKYEHILDGANQTIFNPPTGILFGRGKTSITQKTTNFYRPNGVSTRDRVQILVGHSFQPTDWGSIGQNALGPDFPMTVIQGGEVSLPFPESNFKLQGVIVVDDPWSIARAFVPAINKYPWLEQPSFTWICSEVEWEILNVRTNLYRLTFEFQNNIDTWNPLVVFEDQRTGRPPAKVVQANVTDSNGVLSLMKNPYTQKEQPAGMWTVPALPQVDFAAEFGAVFEGSNIPGVM